MKRQSLVEALIGIEGDKTQYRWSEVERRVWCIYEEARVPAMSNLMAGARIDELRHIDREGHMVKSEYQAVIMIFDPLSCLITPRL